MSRRSQRRSTKLLSWNKDRHTQFLTANEKTPCAAPMCRSSQGNYTTPTGVHFCLEHYQNWLRNNPPGGVVDRADMDGPKDDWQGFFDEDEEDDLDSRHLG